MRKLLLFILFQNSIKNLQAQTLKPENILPDELSAFFIGNWTGDGEFANGKKISADLTFKYSQDSCWILYDHLDKIPNRYKAHSLWGVDKISGQFLSYTFDNFQGHRQFASEGWKLGDYLVFNKL